MTLSILVMVTALLSSPSAGVPGVIVERIVTTGERSVRVALFDNRMAVTTVREGGKQVFQRRLQLEQEEYIAYLAAVNRDAEAVAKSSPKNLVGEGSDEAVVWVSREGQGTTEIRFSPSTIFDLPLARLSASLDDLELHLSEAAANSDELRTWTPRRGDVVELIAGGLARVSSVRQEGFITIDLIDVSVVQTIPIDRCSDFILRVVEKAE